MDNNKKSEIIWRIAQSSSDAMSEAEKNEFIDSFNHMPIKGCGGIQVANGQKDKAIAILKDYVGEFEFKYYPSYNFINENGFPESACYGKFEIEDIPSFIRKLINSGITIINLGFIDYNTVYA
jgi:hypothetical protein